MKLTANQTMQKNRKLVNLSTYKILKIKQRKKLK